MLKEIGLPTVGCCHILIQRPGPVVQNVKHIAKLLADKVRGKDVHAFLRQSGANGLKLWGYLFGHGHHPVDRSDSLITVVRLVFRVFYCLGFDDANVP